METKKQENLNTRRRSGFTLIEILLVVVIIGILAGIGIPALSGHTGKAKIAAGRASITSISTALAIYEMNNGAYPSSLEGLLDSSKAGFPFWDKPTVPKDPWGQPYKYTAPGVHNTYKFDISFTTKDVEYGNWDAE